MSMRRETEFRWQRMSRSRSKLPMSVLLGGVGLATGYMFMHVGQQQGDDRTPASTFETARTPVSPLNKPAIGEPSAVASAAPLPVQLLNPHSTSTLAEPAINERSTVVTAAPPQDFSRARAAGVANNKEPSFLQLCHPTASFASEDTLVASRRMPPVQFAKDASGR